MTERTPGSHPELWDALGRIVPRVESPDTLGTTIATALYRMVGSGRVGVILHGRVLDAGASDSSQEVSYFVRLVSAEATPGYPVYLSGRKGVLARLAGLREPLTLSAPWPAEYAPDEDELVQLARDRLTLIPVPGSIRSPTQPPPAALCLLDVPPERYPSRNELASLVSFTAVAVSLLESKAQAARQAVEFGIISQIGQSLTSSLSLDDIFQQILISVRTAIGATEISVGLIDEKTQEVILDQSLMGPELRELPPVRLKMGQGVAGWVAQTGKPLNVPDAYADPRFYPGVDSMSGFVTRSILCVPLIVEGQVIGVMEAVNKSTGHFSEADEHLLSALASSAAIAIEKARLHADVLAEKRRMEAIFATMSEGLLAIRLDGQITAVNPALQAMIGRDDGDLIGRHCCEAVQTEPDIMQSLLDHMRTPETRAETFQADCDLLREDGRRQPVLVSGAATFDASDAVSEIVIVLSDIGELRELERMKDDFVANVTHELRTPLATILLYARLLRSGKSKSNPQREARYLEIVEQQSNQIQKLVRQILDLSRVEATAAFPKQAGVRLDSVLNELLVSFVRIAHQKGLVIKSDIPADLPDVVSNREALLLIFGNLLDNAVKFTLQGEIKVCVRHRDDQIQIDISDQGIGIASESIPYLFQRFYRTEAAVEQGIGGTGLGLSLVKEAVEKLGGTISVRSWPGRGSTFRVMLPVGARPRAAG
jgi:two-component system phosphate regulon sensor histidine kinase PhoR